MTSPLNQSFMEQSANLFEQEMMVTKRKGQLETVSFDKILKRIKNQGLRENGTQLQLNYTQLAMKVIDQLYDGISTTKIDELSAEQCASLASTHPDYNVLAGRILISNHQKNTSSSFYDTMLKLYNFKDKAGLSSPLVSADLFAVVTNKREFLDSLCDYSRDFLIDYFGFKTLERSYLMKVNGVSIERPQHMWLRVAIGIHGSDMYRIKETYDLMSQKYFTHATPTLFNAGTDRPQLSSCFLLAMEEDSIEGIYNTLKDCALISKYAGGIGLHIHNIRATGSHIRGTNGTSNGIVPMLRVFNNTAKYVDQCLDPDTIVYTKYGAKYIKNIVIGDKVVTDDGQFYTIGKILDNEYYGDLYILDVKHTLYPLKMTDMHPVWTIKNNIFYQRNFNKVIQDLNMNLLVPEFIEVKNIDKNDFIGFPIPTYEKDIVQYTEDDCRFYGIMLGDGNISTVNNLAYVALNRTTKKETVEFVENYLTKLNIHITYTYVNDCYVRLTWTRNNMFKFTYEMLYDTNKEKYVLNNMLHLPKKKVLNLIKGILETDGKVSEHQIVLEITSLSIIESVRYMLMRLGILTSGSYRDRSNESHITKYNSLIRSTKISYILIIPKKPMICNLFPNKNLTSSDSFTFFEYKGFLFSIVNNNTCIKNYSGRVIDIEVDNDYHHNFLTHSGLVKNGGGKRNGSFAIYLEPWHADIEVFLQMRKNHGDEELKARDLFYALWIPDLFMQRVKENGTWTLMCPDECPGLADVHGEEFEKLYKSYETLKKGRATVQARDLWFKIMDAQMETGTPYLCYKDSANRKSNQKNIGTIKSSNLCVAPETLILTDKGHIEIQSLKDETVQVWNGNEFSEVTVRKTGEDQELIKIYTDDGLFIECTPYHKFFIQSSYALSSQSKVDAKDLSIGDKLIKCEYPVIDGEDTILYPYTHGFFCGDGTYRNITEHKETVCKFNALENHHFCKRHIFNETESYLDSHEDLDSYKGKCKALSYSKYPIIYLYDKKKELVSYFDTRLESINDESNNRITVTLPFDIAEKYEVPKVTCSMKTKLEWFAGYCDADGTISRNGENEQLQVASINREFLIKVKLMLQTCGINPKVKLSTSRETSLLPDGKGGHRYFNVQPLYRLLISSFDLYRLCQLGFKPYRLSIIGKEPQRNAVQFIKIIKIENENRISDTYCFTEPKRNMGIFNGILTGQCSEIIEYSDAKETAVCNLASIGLPTFIKSDATFDYEKLHEVSRIVTYNLNCVIDINYYPTEKTRRSNMRHRPIGIGVQGLADVFILMGHPYHSEAAKEINRKIFETIYHAALEESCNLARLNEPYETFAGSPASQGLLQFDLWNQDPGNERYDWQSLKQDIQTHGLRNSLLIAPMPTASTSQILGFNECIEPITSNIYSRRTNAGDFIQANRYLMMDLIRLDLWNEKIKNNIIANNGSCQQIDIIPQEIKDKYKTVWEIPMRHLIDMAADRGAFICQSQSLNLWLEDPNYSTLTSMHFYAWQKGLKTGIYYLRRRGKHQAQQFTIEPDRNNTDNNNQEDEICEMCSS